MRLFTRRSLKGKLFRVMLTWFIVPVALVGLWLTQRSGKSAGNLLRSRLDFALGLAETTVRVRLSSMRRELLLVAADSAVVKALEQPDSASTSSHELPKLIIAPLHATDHLGPSLAAPMVLRNASGRQRWLVGDAERFRRRRNIAPGIHFTTPVSHPDDPTRTGTLASEVAVQSLLPQVSEIFGAILSVIDDSSGLVLGDRNIDPALLREEYFEHDGERWLSLHRSLPDPAITIVAAAPLSLYIVPFQDEARRGMLAIFFVALAGLAVATLLTRRTTRSLESLASATQAVAAGDLDRRVLDDSTDEVGRVGRAFNAMTESLRDTLRQLSQRQALVAVGEFAAALAHEVRNPLTSIRINLQSVQEKLPLDSPLVVPLGRALREVNRLDQTVSGALRIARSGNIASDLVDLRLPLQRAVEVATPAFEQVGAQLDQKGVGDAPVPIRGDEAALEQLFLNILLNAAHASKSGGRATVSVRGDAAATTVEIQDDGAGIQAEKLEAVFEPFFTTKPDGTGLGLAIAHQVVTAHGGEISLTSTVGVGTTVVISLPRAAPS